MPKLSIEDIIKQGIALGLKNFVPLLANAVLYVLTIWIPYLNVGTTIGMVGLIAKMGRAEGISPTEIFNPDYRKYMGEFFLVNGFVLIGVLFGLSLFVIPALVIGIAWSQAALLVLDKGYNPLEAIKKSNDVTYGNKWTIFLGLLALEIVLVVAAMILSFIGGLAHEVIGALLAFVVAILIVPMLLGAQGYIYQRLTADA